MSKKTPNLVCPECGAQLLLKNSRYGPFYGCEHWPKCEGSHCAHPDGSPVGVPANRETKLARRAAHAAFDEVRVVLDMRKGQAYRWLQKAMEMTPEECHMGKFDKATCERVIAVCSAAVAASGGTGHWPSEA